MFRSLYRYRDIYIVYFQNNYGVHMKMPANVKDIFEKEREASDMKNFERPVSNIPAGNLNFSSPQKLPYEKQAEKQIEKQVEKQDNRTNTSSGM